MAVGRACLPLSLFFTGHRSFRRAEYVAHSTLPVQSSALAAIGYSRRLHALEIEFRDGVVYSYFEVPVGIHRDILADSKARFYNKQVRGRYRCLRVRRRRLQ